jgi:hypothetical protein
MCCCDCLLVAALNEVARNGEKQPVGASSNRVPPYEHRPPASIDRVPTRLCGWMILALLHRRWRTKAPERVGSGL